MHLDKKQKAVLTFSNYKHIVKTQNFKKNENATGQARHFLTAYI